MPYTKKQLEEHFKLSRSAVYNRLNDCGLDTNKNEYSDEEIENIFKVACVMMQEGKSREDVRKRFNIAKANKDNGASPPNAQVNNIGSATKITEGINEGIKDFFEKEVDRAVAEIIPYIPYLVENKILEYIETGSLKQAFANYQESTQNPRISNYYSQENVYQVGQHQIAGNDDEYDDFDDD